MGWAKDMLNNKKNEQEQEKKKQETHKEEMENRIKENIERWRVLTVDLICPQMNEVVSDLKEDGYVGQVYTPRVSNPQIGTYENVELIIQPQHGPRFSIRYELVSSSGIITIRANKLIDQRSQRGSVRATPKVISPTESNLVSYDPVELKNFDGARMESTLKDFVKAILKF